MAVITGKAVRLSIFSFKFYLSTYVDGQNLQSRIYEEKQGT